MGDLTKDFSRDELKCPDCGLYIHREEFLYDLQLLRDNFGHPIIVNSGTRCDKHNIKIEGNPFSAHLDGWAADITTKFPMDGSMFYLLKEAFQIFPRIIIADYFIHVDRDPSKPQPLYRIKK